MRTAVCLFLFVASFALAFGLAPLYQEGKIIEGKYLVVFHSNVTSAKAKFHVAGLQKELVKTADDVVVDTFEIGDLRGFSAVLGEASLLRERGHPDVAYVEAEQVFSVAACTNQNSPPSWGLTRVSEKNLNLISPVYIFNNAAGADINAYIIDTGIQIGHNDFQERASWGVNYADNQETDCNGHGTHVAGTVGGAQYGIAKSVNLIAVKVLGCTGSGTTTGVVKGIEWVTTDFQSKKRPSVANMSLGGGASTAIDTAVANSVKAGVFYAVAAGNEDSDACTRSPARVATATTVGSTSLTDQGGKQIDARSSFSNYGTCVDVFAPGSAITSAWIGGNTASNTISGTSMASPHVCGVGAMLLSLNPNWTPAQIDAAIVNSATDGVITLNCETTETKCLQSPNKLLYNGCS